MKIQTSPFHAAILEAAAAVQSAQRDWRRHLHQHPELSNEEFKTTAFLIEKVKGLGLTPRKTALPTGFMAELKGKGDRVVAVRTDIDALPIVEKSGVPFASLTKGKMHACGHDVHMATVLGAAAILTKLRDQVHGTVRFIFQPAEEMPPGGARPMIAAGALKDVSMIFGLHVDPHLTVKKIGLRDGATMASVYDFDLIIRGQTGHAARPHMAVDAIATAAEVIDSLQKVVAREIDPISPVVITFGQIEGGVARNVVADQVKIVGTARTLSASAKKNVPALIRRTVDGICRARGAKFEMREIADYPVLVNDAKVNKLLARSFDFLYGPGKIEETPQVLGGEDFACYLEQVPGAMFRLGVMNKKIKADKPWHSPEFIADEAAMPVGSALLAAVVIDALNGGRP